MLRPSFLLIFILACAVMASGQSSSENKNLVDTISQTNQVNSNDLETESFSPKKDLIHPNPTEGVFQLASVAEGDDISVFDGSGRMVFNTTGEDAKMKIDVTHLEKGVYLVIVRDQNKKLKINQKVMIK